MELGAAITNFLASRGVRSGEAVVFEFFGCPTESVNLDLITRLQVLVGQSGLLAMPTCTHRQGRPKPVFDASTTLSEMGPLSELFRQQPGVSRSDNPTHSLAVWGAKEVTGGHRYAYGRQTPWGESGLGKNSPWDKLLERDAWWVLVDPDWENSPLPAYAAALFCAEYAGLAKTMPFPTFSASWLKDHFAALSGAAETVIAGRAVLLFRMKPAVDGLRSALNNDPAACADDAAFQDWLVLRSWIEMHGRLMVGVAKKKITPPVPFPRWEGKPLTGVFRDLYARVVFFQSEAQCFALALCDLVGLTRNIVDRVREKVRERLPGAAEVMVACTHAHSTPDTISAGYVDPPVLETLAGQIASAVVEARQRLVPARLGWSKTAIRGIAHSRRVKLKDGRVFTTRYGVPSTWRVDPALIAGEGAIDPELAVIRIEDLAGDVLAVISNFGVHPSVALASELVSGDLPGEAMHALEQALGNGAVALCTTGAAADIDPTLEMPFWGPRNERSAARLGRLLAAQVLELLERTVVTDRHAIRVNSQLLDLPVRQDWRELLQNESERMQSEFSKGWQVTPWIASILKSGCFTTEVQAVQLGDLALVAFPGEVFASTSLELKASASIPLVVLEVANDYIGYIPPASAFAEGGYECSQHFASRVDPAAEAVFRAAALKAIAGLKSSSGG